MWSITACMQKDSTVTYCSVCCCILVIVEEVCALLYMYKSQHEIFVTAQQSVSCLCSYVHYSWTLIGASLIGVSQSEPHTSEFARRSAILSVWYVRRAEYTYNILFLRPSDKFHVCDLDCMQRLPVQ